MLDERVLAERLITYDTSRLDELVAAAFIGAGIPAVEFGPSGAGHHGPEEWVSIASLARYRRALGDFVRLLPLQLEEGAPQPRPARRERDPRQLRAIDGGRA